MILVGWLGLLVLFGIPAGVAVVIFLVGRAVYLFGIRQR